MLPTQSYADQHGAELSAVLDSFILEPEQIDMIGRNRSSA